MITNRSIKTIERLSLREQVYRSLKSAITSLELKPGEKIKDQELADKFSVSRTPVREALRRLEDEGLIISAPGSLTSVAEINMKEVKQSFVVVASLHGLAARLAVPSLKDKDIDLLKQINGKLKLGLEKGDLIQAVQADDQFHQVYLEEAKNDEIIKTLERIVPKIRRLEFTKFDSLKAIESVNDHNKIIEASNAKDSESASSLVEKNWLSLGRLLIN